MKRGIFKFLASASFALCVTCAALWLRSYFARDLLDYRADSWYTTAGLRSAGSLEVTTYPRARRAPAGWSIGHGEESWRLAAIELNLDGVSGDHSILILRLPGVSLWHRSRYGGYILELSLAYLSLLAGLLPAFWLIKRLRGMRPFAPGLCRKCGYDLRATPNRCPECGAQAPPVTATA